MGEFREHRAESGNSGVLQVLEFLCGEFCRVVRKRGFGTGTAVAANRVAGGNQFLHVPGVELFD